MSHPRQRTNESFKLWPNIGIYVVSLGEFQTPLGTETWVLYKDVYIKFESLTLNQTKDNLLIKTS